MPKDTSIKRILVIGSGPIVIGQGCEFDYSGVQACKALREEGYEVVLINSNPATIMTDPEFAFRTYIEPITPDIVEKIIIKEKPDVLLPTLGGQTALNTAMSLHRAGTLEKHGVRMIGAKPEAIEKGEDRLLFKNAMLKIGLDLPQSGVAHTMEEARKIADEIGTLPLIIRPAYTLGGTGGGIAYNREEFEKITANGLDLSPVTEVLIEESLLGWKEFEMEVIRDKADNCVIICSIENLDPMGVHTGDSITVAPIQTLTDREYQIMRDFSFACIREIGVETGGSNIQFAVHPDTGRMIVIEMNPRVSRSSALASKATGFPIAKIAAKLAVGYTLDELKNDITRHTPAAFEPTIDYVVTKIPRFTFEKFPGANEVLTTQMKSVGEAMAIGRTFKESLQKALRSLEIKRFGLGADGVELSGQIVSWTGDEDVQKLYDRLSDENTKGIGPINYAAVERALSFEIHEGTHGGCIRLYYSSDLERITQKLSVPNAERIFYLVDAFWAGLTVDDVFNLTKIDRWFLRQIEQIAKEEDLVRSLPDSRPPGQFEKHANKGREDALKLLGDIPLNSYGDPLEPKAYPPPAEMKLRGGYYPDGLRQNILRAKRLGFSDIQLARKYNTSAAEMRRVRKHLNVLPTYRLVDTCAAEFEAYTPYYYSTYGIEDEVTDSDKKKVIILGGGPNRIGQGIEFDYCCVHASFALRELGYETIMVNSNPETVSTDYDTSDKLYFEPLTLEDVLNIYERENKNDQVLGVVVQFGGQTPLNLAKGLEENGVRIIGTSPKSIELAEDRKLFAKLLDDLGLNQAPSGIATSLEEALAVTAKIGYPSLVRPSFVLGGRAMQIVYNDNELAHYMRNNLELEGSSQAGTTHTANKPTLSKDKPLLIDRFLEDATEVDVDCITDGETTVIGAIMEHIEEAGIHSGDSACVIPPFSLSAEMQDRIRDAAKKLAKALNVRGLMNMQLAVKGDDLYVIEVNPRASRTAPFVSKAIGVPLPKLAAKIMAGKTLKELGFTTEIIPTHHSVKEAVFPFSKFPGVDIILGPEMKSTGEVMGMDDDLGMAFAKSQMAAGGTLPTKGNIFISVKDADKPNLPRIAKGYADLGFTLYATPGTGQVITDAGIPVNILPKLASGQRPNVIDLMKNKDMAMVINTPSGKNTREDEVKIRTATMQNRIPIMTTLRGADAALKAIKSLQGSEVQVRALQEYHS
jgi:carbamoyl-phosphate synthase large subunit